MSSKKEDADTVSMLHSITSPVSAYQPLWHSLPQPAQCAAGQWLVIRQWYPWQKAVYWSYVKLHFKFDQSNEPCPEEIADGSPRWPGAGRAPKKCMKYFWVQVAATVKKVWYPCTGHSCARQMVIGCLGTVYSCSSYLAPSPLAPPLTSLFSLSFFLSRTSSYRLSLSSWLIYLYSKVIHTFFGHPSGSWPPGWSVRYLFRARLVRLGYILSELAVTILYYFELFGMACDSLTVLKFAFTEAKCYDLVAFGRMPSQSFVSSFSLLLILSKFLSRTFENESEEAVDCWVQSSAKEFDYSIYSFILLVRVIKWVKKSHSKKWVIMWVIEKYESPMLYESSGMWVTIWLI